MTNLRKACLFLIILWLEGISAQAPGDESAICVDPEGAFFEPPPTNWTVLMDSRNYETLLGNFGGVWDTIELDGDSEGWVTSLGGVCLRTVQACTGSPPQDNWLITQHISKDVAQEIDTYDIIVFVRVTWRFLSCDPNNGCDLTVNAFTFITNTLQPQVVYSDVNQYFPVGSITHTSPTGEGEIILSFTLSSVQDGFYLGFQDLGTCISLNRVTVYRYRCPPMQIGLVLYPDAQSPAIGEILISTSCVDNASPDPSLTLRCSSIGEWIGSPVCSCDCGYELAETGGVQRCDACPAGMYRSDSDSTCQSCPSNTITTGVGVCECPCLEGHFRAPGEGPAVGCTTAPLAFTDGSPTVTANGTVSASFSLVDGDNVRYRCVIRRLTRPRMRIRVPCSDGSFAADLTPGRYNVLVACRPRESARVSIRRLITVP